MQLGRGRSLRRGWRARAATAIAASLLLVAAALLPTVSSPAQAADLSKFDPGNIISDGVFFNSGSMSQSQIQSFLQAKEPTCAASATCVKDYYTVTKSVAADPMCGAYSGGSNERASAIIYKVAQACGINPQVLIVTMQKEQGLITSVWPSDYAYAHAMGADCPDTTGCNSISAGFFAQVYKSAWQMKRYANPPGTSNYFTWYAPGHTWNILYNPNTACGTKAVYVKNQATADLYYYTPYTPNAAALAAGYGTGDSCSAYGNRNFYNYFTDWFGSTQGANPIGSVDLVASDNGSVHVAGWAADPDTANPIDVHVYVGSVGTAFTAAGTRPDVAAAYPNLGPNHGFDVHVTVPAAGAQTICVYGINVGGGSNALLGCRTVTVDGPIDGGNPPIGNFEALSVSGSTGTVAGWAIDPDTPAPITVRFTVGATTTDVLANGSRPDVGAAYPLSGANHGFSAELTLPPGNTTVCASAINTGIGGDTSLGCKTVAVAAPLPTVNQVPVGNFESVVVSPGSLTANGWAIDPNVVTPIAVHVYVDGVRSVFTADGSRPDVAAAYPGYGANHGFSGVIAASAGSHQVCVYAIDSAGGVNPMFGCKTVTVP